MVDLQKEFIAASQDDDRLHTFVVHVPTLGANEDNVPAAMELLNGPRVTHYWNGGGEIGHQYTKVLDIEPVYAWDVWMTYPDDIIWEDELPPRPSYWQHQLGVDKGHRFDPQEFAEETSRLMDQADR
jgi:hypothetical protein